MHIVMIDGCAANSGDLSLEPIALLGTLTSNDRTADADIVPRARGAKIVLTTNTVRETIRARHVQPDLSLRVVVVTPPDGCIRWSVP